MSVLHCLSDSNQNSFRIYERSLMAQGCTQGRMARLTNSLLRKINYHPPLGSGLWKPVDPSYILFFHQSITSHTLFSFFTIPLSFTHPSFILYQIIRVQNTKKTHSECRLLRFMYCAKNVNMLAYGFMTLCGFLLALYCGQLACRF